MSGPPLRALAAPEPPARPEPRRATGAAAGARTRRQHAFLRTAFLLLLLIGVGVPATAQRPGAERPNVILIYSDDQGTLDLNVYGAKDLHTPHLDALASRGVRFTQFYAPAPLCSPSRAGLMTGRHPVRAGMPGNAPSEEGRPGMPAAEVTLAETLRQAGYATAHIGKWHLGYTPETMPNGQGFDHSFGHMGGCIDNYSHFFYWNGPNRHDLHRNGEEVHHDGRFFPDLMVEEASRFMERSRDRPFFIYFAINTPHYPYQGEPKWLEHYRDLPYPRNLYAAFVSSMDERVGTLLRRVDELGLRENTIVVFQSDHGHSVEERAHGGGGFAGPYRGAKGSMFEGGLRVPAIISWPGRLPQGEVRNQVAHGTDWLPTLAELTGARILNPDLDGRSLVEVIRSANAPTPHPVLHWQLGTGGSAQWAVRQGDWKLMGNVRNNTGEPFGRDDGTIFLSNLSTDPSERTNLAGEQPEVVRRLQALRDEWVARHTAAGSPRSQERAR